MTLPGDAARLAQLGIPAAGGRPAAPNYQIGDKGLEVPGAQLAEAPLAASDPPIPPATRLSLRKSPDFPSA